MSHANVGNVPQTVVQMPGKAGKSATKATLIPQLAASRRRCCDLEVGAPDRIRTCGLCLRRAQKWVFFGHLETSN